jgi:hypothetical protein
MKDLEKKELVEIKALLDASLAGQARARWEFERRLYALGFEEAYLELQLPYEDKKLIINVSYEEGRFEVEIYWNESEDDYCSRPATAEEVILALREYLLSELESAEKEIQRDWELAKSLPTEEELAKVRRRIEDYLRKNPREIPAVAKLLKIL